MQQGPQLTREQSRQIDQLAIDRYGMSGTILMENAGRGVADALEKLGIEGWVAILCGRGNNAGDGFVAARHLAARAHECKVILLFPPSDLEGDAAANYAMLEHSGVPIIDLSAAAGDAEELRGRLDQEAADAEWLIDAMLGTGATGNPRPPLDTVIDWFNKRDANKLAIDVPTGLDCDTGMPATHTVRADHTCTFVAGKIGFSSEAAHEHTGTVHVLDIGIPPSVLSEVRGEE